MDRRKYLKSLVVGTAGAGLLLQSCKDEKPQETVAAPEVKIDRYADELAYEKKLQAGEPFFTEHEMKTISILADIIIPADGTSGSASDAKVPEFISFIVKDMPRHQVPLRGGLRWLDLQCMRRYNTDFAACSAQQQIEMIDAIAYPETAKPEMQAGVAFFNLMRDLTATGFFTSEMGLKDLGYQGNRPNQWDGVPEDVLKQYGLAYDQRTLDISVKHNT
jgi:gluconate 2-dehydrogenase gamma chain